MSAIFKQTRFAAVAILGLTLLADKGFAAPKSPIGGGSYQDIIVGGDLAQKGYVPCAVRYELIRPILDLYENKFTVLDVGALEGYFSLKIAQDYGAFCTMVEGGSSDQKGKLYSYAQDNLLTICKHNPQLNNIEMLAHRLTVPSLTKMAEQEHFDVVLAFLVVHLMASDDKGHISEDKVREFVDIFLSMGNDVIIETSTDCYLFVDTIVQEICKEKNGRYLGELPRVRNYKRPTRGRFYWFSQSDDRNGSNDVHGVSAETFVEFNGIYPQK